MIEEYISPLVQIFESSKDLDRAISMERYMKNKFPFLGISSPERKELIKSFLTNNGRPVDVLECSDFLWNLAFREYQYTGLTLLDKYKKRYEAAEIKFLENLITTKSWWDTVDHIAANFVGAYFRQHPEKTDIILKWSDSDNMWLKRTAILFQLKYKSRTDTNLLTKIIERHKSSNEFFIKKAIGWALREYSKTDSDFVIEQVSHSTISNFSKTEALKWIKNHK